MVAKKDLTDRTLKALKAAQPGKRRIVWDARVPGLGIRVTDKAPPDRKGSFVLVVRYPGSKNPVPRSLGDYPAMSLATARERARQWRELLGKGIDPSVAEERQRHEEELRQADTFAGAWTEYKAEHLDKLRTGKNIDATIRRLAMPRFGSMPLTDIRARDGRELFRQVAKDAPIEANRLRSYLLHFFGWCIEEEKIEESPIASIKRPTKETKRERYLTETEILALWRACDDLGAFGRAFRLMLTSGQRRSEVGNLAWTEIDPRAKIWRLPPERTKAGREHEVPLSPLAVEIIEASPKVVGNPYVFSTVRGSRGSAAVPLAGWSKAKVALDRAMLAELQKIARERSEEAPVELRGWRLHDLRRSAATYLGRLGIDRVVVAKVLNHREIGQTATYDRDPREPEKRRALDLWGARLRSIIDGTDGGNVVSFPARG